MSLDGLLESMTREAVAARGAILAQAEAEARQIRQVAKDQVEAERRTATDNLQRELATLERQEQDRAEAEAARQVFSARDEVAGAAFDKARIGLIALAQRPDFVRILGLLLQESAALVDSDDPVELRVPAGHAEAMKAVIDRMPIKAARIVADTDLQDGIILQGPPGTFRITNRLTDRLERLSVEGRGEVYGILFKDGGHIA